MGGWHPYETGNEQHRIWGILSGGGAGICANTYERERLAWINPTVITGDILNAPFQDYVAYGTAYKYHPPNGEANEYYFFENHQKLSIYDNATTSENDKGIFVIHQQNVYNETNNIRIKTSNGQWNWQNPFSSVCFSNSTVPAFKPSTVNRQGLNNRDKLPKSGGGSDWLFSLIKESGQASCGDYLHGDGLNNSFNTTYKDVFSPYSNPYTHTWNNSQNNFTMEIIGQNGSVVNAKFNITSPLSGKPSKPQNYNVTIVNIGGDTHPKLTWELNLETDVINASQAYLIERSLNGGAFTQIAAVNGSTSEYIDYDLSYAGSGPNTAVYKIRAKDTQGLTSLYTEGKSVAWGDAWKIGTNAIEIVKEYKLQQNYPNPFNPMTSINYQIKEKGLVSLKVFDMLGKEVAELVNETKDEGQHSIMFDASNLPSGVYIYSLRVNDYVQNNKMTLLK
ncbi:MAG TPA: T9SS type A sorting domain-containing protein [Ignavibacteriaceae bacterium]|nr:T9SS type A sorting domain-containing protein [Ignavibacteriaceae bacterium]